MRRILCTDIFGHTEAIDNLVAATGHAIEVVSPYGEKKPGFKDEQMAYKAFTEAGGVEAYVSLLSELLTNKALPLSIVGFSAGACAAYVALNRSDAAENGRLLGFYPGQIRHYLSLQNRCETTLVFPASEAHFDLTAVCHALQSQPRLTQISTPYQHGFMNPLSQGFEPAGLANYEEKIRTFLS